MILTLLKQLPYVKLITKNLYFAKNKIVAESGPKIKLEKPVH